VFKVLKVLRAQLDSKDHKALVLRDHKEHLEHKV
jgi:hypothetical protein